MYNFYNWRYLMLIIPLLWDGKPQLMSPLIKAGVAKTSYRTRDQSGVSRVANNNRAAGDRGIAHDIGAPNFITADVMPIVWEQPTRVFGGGRGPLPDAQLVTGTLRFKLRNAAALDALIQAQQDPHSPQYQQWLTATEFGAQFGADPETYQAVQQWMQQMGLSITRRWANRLSLEFTASAAVMARVWQTTLTGYEQDQQHYYSALTAPKIPANWVKAVASIKLHNFPQFSPQIRLAHNATVAIKQQTNPVVKASTNQGTGHQWQDLNVGGQLVAGAVDIQRVYQFEPLFAQGIRGQGQQIGIVARSDFELADIELFRSLSNLPSAKVVKIPVGNVVNRQGLDELEVLLDTQLAGAAAPAATLQVVIADRQADIDQSLAFLVNNLTDTKVISVSFNLCERDLTPAVSLFFNNLYKQAAAQGQTVLVASGDAGANDCGDARMAQVGGLATSPFVTAVGGTSLTLAFDNQGNAIDRVSETAWTGSGGGESLFYPRPDYQRAITTTGRTIPDIALAADPSRPGLFIVQSGFGRAIGGTSAATPLWAGVFSLVNQFAQTTGIGLANPRIYQLGQAQQQGQITVFQDIITGNNSNNGVIGFMAAPGYDLVTGWGAPQVTNLVTNFVNPQQPNPRQLFLLFPNGANFLPLQQETLVRWQVNEPLASQITSQDLLVSNDNGVTFKPLAMGLSPTARSFAATLTAPTAQARLQIVVHTAQQTVADLSDAAVNVGTPLAVNFAQYSTINNRLEIIGAGFTGKIRLIVNGRLSTRKTQTLDAQTVVVPGTENKLRLRPGRNTIQLKVDGLVSAPYVLML